MIAASPTPVSSIVSEADMREITSHACAGGAVVAFSRRAPDKDTPNEDAFAVVPIDDERAILVVADGLGGRPAGENASRTAVSTIERYAREVVGNGDSLRTAILDALEETNRALLAGGTGAGTTVAVVELAGARARPYHVGDSEILVVGQRGRIKFQSVAHSPTAYAVESGLLDHEEALEHEDRHLLLNMLGDEAMRIEIGSWIPLGARDTVLLATDGLFDNVRLDEIVSTVRCGPLERAGRTLADLCHVRMTKPAENAPSKPDDMTFLLFRRSVRPGRRRTSPSDGRT